MKIKTEDKPIARNEDWISENRRRAQKWLYENARFFGNSKGSTNTIEVFYTFSDLVIHITLRYPICVPKGNEGDRVELNQPPYRFEDDLVSTVGGAFQKKKDANDALKALQARNEVDSWSRSNEVR